LLRMETASDKWNACELVARRMKRSNPDVVLSALRRLSDRTQSPTDGVKTMILLRVCFDCPEHELPGVSGFGWVSASEGERGTVSRTVAWPVVRKYGRFHLRDSIDGYLAPGLGYDGAAEFQWMLTNCAWRSCL